jgi:hypothetical protein
MRLVTRSLTSCAESVPTIKNGHAPIYFREANRTSRSFWVGTQSDPSRI